MKFHVVVIVVRILFYTSFCCHPLGLWLYFRHVHTTDVDRIQRVIFLALFKGVRRGHGELSALTIEGQSGNTRLRRRKKKQSDKDDINNNNNNKREMRKRVCV